MKLTESGMFLVNYGALVLTGVAAWVPVEFIYYLAYGLLWVFTILYGANSLWLLRQDIPYKFTEEPVMSRQLYVAVVLGRAFIMLVSGWHWLFAMTLVSCVIHWERWVK